MVHAQRTSDEKRPGRGRQRINPREFATTGPRTPETAANYLLHRGLRQDGGGDQRGVSAFCLYFSFPKIGRTGSFRPRFGPQTLLEWRFWQKNAGAKIKNGTPAPRPSVLLGLIAACLPLPLLRRCRSI